MMKRFIAGLLAVLMTGVFAYGASVTISGGDTQHRFQTFWMGIPRITRDETITATAGGTITTAYQLTAGISYVTTVTTTGDAVKLPNTTGLSPGGGGAGGGLQMVIVNAGANSLNVFPFQAADTINAGSGGAAYALASGKTAIFFVGTDGKWFAVLSA